MPTIRLTIDTTPIPVLMFDTKDPSEHFNFDQVAKIILQNLGATDLYWGHDANVTTANGHLLAPNGVFIDEIEIEPLWIVSNAAGGLLVITVQKYLNSNVTRIVK